MVEIPNLITNIDLVNKIGELTVHILNVENSYEELKQSSDTLKSDNTLFKNESEIYQAENLQYQSSVKNLTITSENLMNERQSIEKALRNDINTLQTDFDKQLNDLRLSVKKKEKTIADLKDIVDRTTTFKKKTLKGKVRA